MGKFKFFIALNTIILILSCSSRNEEELPDFGAVESKTVLERIFGSENKNNHQKVEVEEDYKKLRERGEYLVKSGAACGSCHGESREDPESPLSGGGLFNDRFSKVYASNITPDKETGIGNWTVSDVILALRSAESPEGRLLSVDFHASYKWLADLDLKAIASYILSQRPIKNPVEERVLGTFEKRKWGIFSQHDEFKGYVPKPVSTNNTTYARYLTFNVSRCAQCHTASGGLLEDAIPFSGGEKKDKSLFSSLRKLVKSISEISKEEDPDVKKDNLKTLLSNEGKREYFGKLDQESTNYHLVNKKNELKSANSTTGVNSENDAKVEQGELPSTGPDIRGTVENALLHWTKEDIVNYLNTGKNLSASVKDTRLCPWTYFKNFSEQDKEIIANYLKQQ